MYLSGILTSPKFNSSGISLLFKFFIIINQPQENNKEEICIDQLNEKYLKIKEGLLRCGNIVTNVNNEKETKEIIRNYIFLNDDENRM